MNATLTERAKQRHEQFYPTCALRYRQQKSFAATLSGGGNAFYTEQLVLEQKFVSNHGNEEWREIPVEVA